MLEKPELADDKLIACLRADYGLRITEVAFLPLGNDRGTAVYRVVADDATAYFLKLRRGAFDEAIVAIPHFLSAQGIAPVIAPIETRAGQLWTHVDAFTVVLYPFVAGRSGFQTELSDRHWIELGAALRGMHTAVPPPALTRQIPREKYGSHWRDLVRTFQARARETAIVEPVAAQLAAFLRTRHDEIAELVERAEQLGTALQARSLDDVLCHADLHAGNVLIDASGALYVVDWDTVIFAPKERDLMFVGAGVGGIWHRPREAELFYQGYGQTRIDPMALAYYRHERIVEDIAEYCTQLLLTDEGGEDRERGLQNLVDQFLPNQVVEIARASDYVPGAE